MKSLSAALVVLSGVGTLCFSSIIAHDDTQLFMGAVGLIVAGIGIFGWFMTLRESDSVRD